MNIDCSGCIILLTHQFPTDIWRNDNVIMTSKWRRFDVIMTLSLRHGVICPLGYIAEVWGHAVWLHYSDVIMSAIWRLKSTASRLFIVRRAGLLWSQQDFEWRWSVPLFKCLTVLEFSFILFDLCLLITFFNFIMNYVPIVTFWIFTYHKIWILSIMFCSIWSYWIIYFLACLEVSWRVVS